MVAARRRSVASKVQGEINWPVILIQNAGNAAVKVKNFLLRVKSVSLKSARLKEEINLPVNMEQSSRACLITEYIFAKSKKFGEFMAY